MMYSKFPEIFQKRQSDTKSGKEFWVGKDITITYGQLYDKVARTTTLLRNLGLAQDDRVVIASDDGLAVIVLFFAMLRSGVTVVFLDPNSTWNEAKILIGAADVKAVFLDEELRETYFLDEVFSDNEAIIDIVTDYQGGKKFLGGLFKKKAAETEKFPASIESLQPFSAFSPEIPEDTVAYILFTSGTTSRPKGVEITHKNLYAQEETFVKQYQMSQTTQLLNVLPLYHTDGLTHGPVLAFMAGGTIHRPSRFRVDNLAPLIDSIYRKRITNFITVPSVLALMKNLGADYVDSFNTPDFKFLISTAAYLDPELWRYIESTFSTKVVNVYGLTETVCEALYCGPSDETRKVGTVGKPVDCEARIVDAEKKTVASGITGELQLRGDHIMKGYFRQPAETAEVLSVDGWFSTGDLATVDNDGFYNIVGRIKNVIITAGINVYPEDVDNVLRTMPEIVDAVTFGVEDQTWGERVVSFVIAKDGSSPSTEDIAGHCAENLAREKMPNKIHIVDAFPRGPSGKVILKEIKAMALELDTSFQLDTGVGDLAAQIFSVAASIFKMPVEELSKDSNPDNTWGWNSLAHVEFLVDLERVFDITMSARDIMNIKNMGDAISAVERKCMASA